MNSPTITIYGASYESNNLGVRALCSSLIQLAVAKGNTNNIQLLYGAKNPNEYNIHVDSKPCRLKIVNFRLSPYSNYKDHLFVIIVLSIINKILYFNKNKLFRFYNNIPWLQSLHRSDYVLEINGGDSFSDIYGFKNFILRVLPQAIAILFNRNPILLPQTYGPYKNKIAKHIAFKLIRMSPRLFSRDFESARYLTKNITNLKVTVCPDVAFVLKPIEMKNRIYTDSVIGLNISGLLYNGGYNRNNMFSLKDNYEKLIINLIENLIKNYNNNILLIPHVYEPGIENDLDAIIKIGERVEEKYRRQLHFTHSKLDEREVKGLIKQTDFFIGTRMHSCIAALSQCIPCVGLAYSKKFTGVFKILEMEDCVIDLRKNNTEESFLSVQQAFEHKERIRKKLSIVVPFIQETISDQFNIIFHTEPS